MRTLPALAFVAGLAAAGLCYSVTGQSEGAAQPLAPDDAGPVGRYQLITIQEPAETTLWMLDSATGRIWRRYAQPDGDHWTQTIREDYPQAAVRLQGMPPKPPAPK